MQSQSSSRAAFRPEEEEGEFQAPANVAGISPGLSPREFEPFPPFVVDTANDPAPAHEDEVAAWVASICKNPREWLPRLTAASQGVDMRVIRAQFKEMYQIYAGNTVSSFFESHFRRPETPAGTKPFPLRIEITAFLLCAGVAILGGILLVLTR